MIQVINELQSDGTVKEVSVNAELVEIVNEDGSSVQAIAIQAPSEE